jgi:hypothetical protein
MASTSWLCSCVVRAAFKDFLAGEFSVENLMFYLGACVLIDPISQF